MPSKEPMQMVNYVIVGSSQAPSRPCSTRDPQQFETVLLASISACGLATANGLPVYPVPTLGRLALEGHKFFP